MDMAGDIEVRESCGGRGVFTRTAVRAGERLLKFAGEPLVRTDVARVAKAHGHDGYLQIGPDAYLGLSGGADDYVNHACEPNCHVQFSRTGVYLVARYDIAAGDELFFDYALTQIDFPFRFHCMCGHAACRGDIGNFDEVPSERMRVYRAERVLPDYIEEAMDSLLAAPLAQQTATVA